MKQKILMVAAVFFGVLAFIFAYQEIKMERKKIESSAVKVRLIRMKTDVPENEKLSESDIEMYEAMRFAGSANTLEIPWEHRNDVIGSELRSRRKRGDILSWRDFDEQLVTKSRTGLPAQTRPGWRAVSVPVTSVTSVSGLIRPNNYVDVIGTFHFPDAKGNSSRDTVTKTILQRVKVLATGSDLGYVSQTGAQNNNFSVAGRSYSAVTLELTPKEVELIVFAQQKGSLTLSLRSYDDSSLSSEVQFVEWSNFEELVREYGEEREKLLRKSSGSGF